MTVQLPRTPQETDAQKKKTLTIIAKGAPTKPYVKSLTINGRKTDAPIVRHEDISNGGEIIFEMSDKVEAWGNSVLVSSLVFVQVVQVYTDLDSSLRTKGC